MSKLNTKKVVSLKIVGAVFAVLLMVCLLAGLSSLAYAETTTVASGTVGTTVWQLDSSGELVIRPSSGTSGAFSTGAAAGWGGHAADVKSVRFVGDITISYPYEMFKGCKSLTVVDMSGVSVSGNARGMFLGCSSLQAIDFASADMSGVTSMLEMFRGCSSLESASFGEQHAASMSTTNEMFAYCSNLLSVDMSGFVPASSVYAGEMFNGCQNLTSVRLDGFSGSAFSSMYRMFENCSSLEEIDLTGIVLDQDAVLTHTFYMCPNLTTIRFSFDGSTSSMDEMCYGCSSLTSIDLSRLNTENASTFRFAFKGCSSLTSVNIENFNPASADSMVDMFAGCSSLVSVNFGSIGETPVQDMSGMFSGCSSLTSVDMSGLQTTDAVDIRGMFENCSALETVDLSGYVSVSNTDGMFNGCKALRQVDLGGLTTEGTSNTADLYQMFKDCRELTSVVFREELTASRIDNMFDGCTSLVSVDLSPIKTNDAVYTAYMFSDCSAIESVVLGNIVSGDSNAMFYNCVSLVSIVFNGFDTSETQYMSEMFYGCESLETIDVSSLDTSSVCEMGGMFMGCLSLRSIDISSWDMSSCYYSEEMFGNVPFLNSITLGQNSLFPGINGVWVGEHNGLVFNDTDDENSLGFSDYDGSTMADRYIRRQPNADFYAILYKSGELVIQATNTPDQSKGEYYEIMPVADFEDGDAGSPETPLWIEAKDLICSVVVADPIEVSCTRHWFYGCGNLREVDIALLTLSSNYYSTEQMFYDASNVYKITFGPNFRDIYGGCGLPSGTWVGQNSGAEVQTYYLFSSSNPNTSVDTYVRQGTYAILYESGELDIQNSGEADPAKGSVVRSYTVNLNKTYYANSAPWSSAKYEITSVVVVDEITPASIIGWFYGCENMISADLSNINTERITSFAQLFYGCAKLEEVDISSFGSAQVTDCSSMFAGCETITEIDISVLDAASLTSTTYMFNNCRSLTTLNLSGFSAPSLRTMSYMFSNCRQLTSIDVSGFDTHAVTHMSDVFCNCMALTSLDLSSWDLSSVVSMQEMFKGCSSLESITFGPNKPSALASAEYAFFGCNNLAELDLSGFRTTQSVKTANMFASCSSLRSLNIVDFDTRSTASLNAMFNATDKMTEITLGPNFSFKGSAASNSDWASLSHGLWTGSSSGTSMLSTELRDSYSADLADTYVKNMIYAVLYEDGTLEIGAHDFALDGRDNVVKTYSFACASQSSDNCPWVQEREQIRSVIVTEEVFPLSTYYLFYGCKNLTSLDLTLMNTSSTTSMSYMFWGCSSLTSIDISGFDMQKTKSLSWMFYGCTALRTVVVGYHNAPELSSLICMFSECSRLKSVDLSGLENTVLTSINGLFQNCFALVSADLSNLDTSRVVSMERVFQSCQSLESLNISGIDTSAVKYFGAMFYGCNSLAELDVSGFNTSSATDMNNMFAACSSLHTLDVSGFETENVTNFSSMFSSCLGLCSIDVSSFDTENATTMGSMFSGCQSLGSLDLSSFDTRKVVNMSYMFSNCGVLQTLDISSFDTSNVTNFQSWMSGCNGLSEITLGPAFKFLGKNISSSSSYRADIPTGNWQRASTGDVYTETQLRNSYTSSMADTYIKQSPFFFAVLYESGDLVLQKSSETDPEKGNVVKIYAIDPKKTIRANYVSTDIPWWNERSMVLSVSMKDEIAVASLYYYFYNCTNLVSADLSLLDTSSVTSAYSMFYGCQSLENLKIDTFDTSAITDIAQMFYGCKSLKELDLSFFNQGNQSSLSSLCSGCSSLESINLSSFNSTGTSVGGMFNGCDKLASVTVGPQFSFKGSDTHNVSDSSSYRNYWAWLPGGYWVGVNTGNVLTDLTAISSYTGDMADTYISPIYSAVLYSDGTLIIASEKEYETGHGDVSAEYDFRGNGYRLADQIPWKNEKAEITEVIVKDSIPIRSLAYLFSGCTSLVSADLSMLNTQNLGSMRYTFQGCSALSSADLRGFGTSNVTTFESTFSGCSCLASLDLSSFDTMSATTLVNMFTGCDSLSSVKLGHLFSFTGGSANYNYATLPNGTWTGVMNGISLTADQLRAQYTSSMADTYVRSLYNAFLYDTGELVLQKSDAPDPAKGTVVKSYIFDPTSSSRPWSGENSRIITFTVADPISVGVSVSWFSNCANLTSINASLLDTSRVTNMASLFSGCSSLTELDLSWLDTSSVTSMDYMFRNCTSLRTVDISGFDTEDVRSFAYMFSGCSSLTSVNFGTIDTKKVSSMYYMFQNCLSLESIDLSGFETNSLAYMYSMFYRCSSLEYLDIGSFNTSNVTGSNMSSAFYGCNALKTVVLGPDFNFVSTTLPSGTWTGQTNGLSFTEADLASDYNSSLADTYVREIDGVFAILYESGKLVVQASDTEDPNEGAVAKKYAVPKSAVSTYTDIPWYSDRMSILSAEVAETVDVFGTAYWFYGCENMVSADVHLLDTSAATTMASMFYGCSSLESVNIAGISVSSVTSMASMFSGCTSLVSLDMSGLDTQSLINMTNMFYGCRSLSSVNLSGFNTEKVTNMQYMFYNCSSLTSVDLSSFSTPLLSNCSSMFYGCSSLISIDMRNMQTKSGTSSSTGTNTSSMFGGCVSLTEISLGSSFKPRGYASSLASMGKLPDGSWIKDGMDPVRTWSANIITQYYPGSMGLSAGTYRKIAGFVLLYENGDLVFQGTATPDASKGPVYKIYSVDPYNSSYSLSNVPWVNERDMIKTVAVLDDLPMNSTSCWFQGCTNLTTVDMAKLLPPIKTDTGGSASAPYTNSVSNMFNGCANLTVVDISSMDTTRAGYLSNMFAGCDRLSSVKLGPNFSFTGSATSSSNFAILPSGKWIHESGSVPALTEQEMQAYNGKPAGEEGYNGTPAGIYRQNVFTAILYESGELVLQQPSEPDETKGAVAKIYKVDADGYTSKAAIPWSGDKLSIKSVSVDGNVSIGNMSYLFANCQNLTSVDLTGLDTSGAAKMNGLFSGCSSLTDLNISSLNTNNVTDMNSMFYGCSSLEELDLSPLNTENVKNMSSMFAECSMLSEINLENFDTSSATILNMMFKNCKALRDLDVSTFVVQPNTNMSYLFYGCDNLSKITLGEDFRFINSTNKLTMSNDREVYTGKWIKEDLSVDPMTPEELAAQYDSSNGNLAGTWIWQKAVFGAAVVFNANGGSTTLKPIVSDSNYVNFVVPDDSETVRPNYVLRSWNTEIDGSGDVYAIGDEISKQVEGGSILTLYAQWRMDTRVAYSLYHYYRNIQGNGFNLTTEQKKSDWFIEDEPEGTVTEYFNPPVGFRNPTAYLSDIDNTFSTPLEVRRSPNVTFTPNPDGSTVVKLYYERQTYKIRFDGNGADYGYMADQTVVREIQTLLKKNNFEKSGTFFVGWNTKSDGSGTSYADQQPITNIADPDETITLYAQWFTITGGDGPQESNDGSLIVSAKGGQTIVISGLPNGTKYTVEEVVIPAGWSEISTIQDKSGGNATIAPNVTKEAEVTNRYQAVGKVSLEAHVKLEGGPLQSGQFIFKSSDPEGELEILTNAGIDNSETVEDDEGNVSDNRWFESGPVSFAEITINNPGTYTYYIEQIESGDERIDYDIHTEEVTVVATDNGNGTLDVEAIYDADGPLFINRMRSGAVLTVSKEIRNETAASQDQEFTFTVDVRDSENMLVSGTLGYKIYQTSQIQPPEMVDEGTIAMGGTFQMKGGQYIELTGIPYGATYEITESPQTGWEQISAEGSSGFMEESPLSAQFINVYSTSGSAQIEATKTFIGGTIQREQFEFELHRNDGTLVESVYAGIDGSIVFTPLDFDESDAGQTYSYYIVEKAGSGDIIYDQSIKEVSIYIEDDGIGHMATEVTYANNDNVFVNRNITALIVETEVHGNIADLFDIFDYTMVLTNGDGTPFTGDITPEGDQMNWAKTGDGTYSFSLQARTSTTVKLPSGIHFVITETPKDYLVRIAMTQGNGSLTNQSNPPVAEEETDGAVGDTVVVFKNYLISVVPTGIDDVATIGMDITGIAVLAGVLMMLLKKRKSKKAEAEQ